MKIDPAAVALVAMLLSVTVGWLIFSAIVRSLARAEFRRMFKGVLMIRGKGGKFERLR